MLLTYGRWPRTSNNTRVAWFICHIWHGRPHHPHQSSTSFFWNPGRRIVLDRVIYLQQKVDSQLLWLSLINFTYKMSCISRECSWSCACLAVHSRHTRHCSSSWRWRPFLRWWLTTISSRSCWFLCRQRLSRGAVQRRVGQMDVQQSA